MPDTHEPKPDAVLTLDEMCGKAMEHQLAGRLDLAAQLYSEILQIQPMHSVANYSLGLLHVQVQRPEGGLPYLLAALKASPETADYWLGYIEALLMAGQTDAARQTLELGQQHGLTGAAAENLASRILSSQPKPPVEEKPTPASKHSKPFAQAVRKKGSPTRQQSNELVTLFTQGRYAEGVTQALTLTQRFPEHGPGWKILGAMLRAVGRNEEGLAAMREAAELLPDDAETQKNLGVMLVEANDLAEGERHYRRALAINPGYAAVHTSLGGILSLQGRNAEAEASYRAALAFKPGDADAEVGLARTLGLRGEIDLALPLYRSALGKNPEQAAAVFSNMLFMLSHSTKMDAAALFAEHCRFAEKYEAPYRASWPKHANSRDPHRCLKVGLVSGDFYNHAVAPFIEPILAQLQKRAATTLELHAYYNHFLDDDVTQRLRSYMPHWNVVNKLSDTALTQQILNDKIDILIDLSGHTGRNRLLSFARKPAPVQVTWIGYPGTTGLQAMDYYLADRHFLPPGRLADQFTEKIAYLPAAAPFSPFTAAPAVNVLPALKAGHLTFGSFNRANKINAETIAMWSQLLRALPDARMLLGGLAPEYNSDKLIEEFVREGIARERLIIHLRSDMETYLGLHHLVDICLDAYPYSGGTTTYHAIWMGVPTLTVGGATAAGRSGASILDRVGLDAFVADNADDFVQKGVSWASNLAALADIRQNLRERFAASATCQPEVVAAGVERALRSMWQRYCAELPPASFEVPLQDVLDGMSHENKQ
ncbi:MAG: Tetratricopeptide 2 repeat protein [Proteobacteria bacterium]|nr:Tetratricopeptide 2 repeat protein [Pseudomonadota bacterium]